MIKKPNNTPCLFSNLSDMLNQSHPLYQLADKIDWGNFETAFYPSYCQDNGRPGKPIRLVCGLLILKHLRNLSDGSLAGQWGENAYHQYSCGMREFVPSAPCASSEPVHFRNRIGEGGIGLIFQESIRVNDENNDGRHHDTAFVDSAVQEKNVACPTDARSHKKIVKKVPGMVKKPGLPLRQGYTFVLKGNYRDRRFRNHPKDRKEALGADRRLRTTAGRLVRELKRNLKGNHDYDRLLELLETILSRRRDSRKKVHSVHEPEVQCIGKGKGHKKYEFGNKVSIVRSATGIILGAMAFRNEHDGHAIGPSLEQVERLTGKKIKVLVGDRGYGGKKEINGTRIVIPDMPKKSDSRHQGLKKHELFRKRAGMEASTGHLKSVTAWPATFIKVWREMP